MDTAWVKPQRLTYSQLEIIFDEVLYDLQWSKPTRLTTAELEDVFSEVNSINYKSTR